jgi:hypothetical protein
MKSVAIVAITCALAAQASAQSMKIAPLVVNPGITPTVECIAANTGNDIKSFTLTLFTADAPFPVGTTFFCSGAPCSIVGCEGSPSTSCPGRATAATPTPCPASTPCPACSGVSCDGTACWTGTTPGGTAAQITCATVEPSTACIIRASLGTVMQEPTPTASTTSVVLCRIDTIGSILDVRASLISLDASGAVHTSAFMHQEDND